MGVTRVPPDRRIPIIGDFIFHAGQVVDIVSQPCPPSAWIAVTAFWQYLPMIVWAVAKPEPIDDAINRFGRTHSKKRRRRARVVDVTIGKKPALNRVGTVLFPIQDAIQKYGFYFIVVDATIDFFVNWTSAAYLFNGCQVPFYNNLSVQQTTTAGYGTSSPSELGMGPGAIVEKHVYDYVPPVFKKTAPGPWKLALQTTVNPQVTGRLTRISINENIGFKPEIASIWEGSAGAGETVTAVYTDMNVFAGMHDILFFLYHDGGLALDDTYVSLVGQTFKVEGLGADP